MRIVALLLLALTSAAIAAPVPEVAASQTTRAGIALDAAWKRAVYAHAQKHAQHTAWGVEHSERNYLLAIELARAEKLAVDTDVLFAAAFLHDLGAIDAFRKDGVDHAVRSVELLPEVLGDTDFPRAKLARVEAAILGHMYNADPGASPEARVFHDADTLDFLGAIGAARIFSLTTRHPWAQSMETAAKTLRGFVEELPPALETEAAAAIGKARAAELSQWLDALDAESVDGKAR